jgi:hypothetical protein
MALALLVAVGLFTVLRDRQQDELAIVRRRPLGGCSPFVRAALVVKRARTGPKRRRRSIVDSGIPLLVFSTVQC